MLTTDHSQLKDHYNILIIGSGYGGAITAARLGYANRQAGDKYSIAIFERGVEHPNGSLPVTATQFAGQLLTPFTPLGLFEFVLSTDFAVVQGSGLGGTSLVNGGVCIRPDKEAFNLGWPRAIRDDGDYPMEQYYARAERMLGANQYADHVALDKVKVFERMSQAVDGERFEALNIAVSRESRTTKYGIPRRPCVNCSSCISGCNYEAKNTLDKNYLPMARHFGVDMFTRMEVSSFHKLPDGKGYQLAVKYRKSYRGTQVEWKTITADKLILAAGCLGTTGIMLRSESPRLQFSKQLGQHFSGNGDFFALAYNMNETPNFNGWGIGIPEEFHVKGGPTITSVFHLNEDKPIRQRVIFEEASMPSPFVNTMRNLAFAATAGQPFWTFLNTPNKIDRWWQDRERNNTGAINSSLLYLGIGFDGAKGIIKLTGSGAVTIEWPDAADDEVFKILTPPTIKGAEALGGNQYPNPMLQFNLPVPLWPPYLQKPMTGHPIGGCSTSDDVDNGVVDDVGRVFDPNGGVHDGLYIFDGSVFPNSIGVNVLLTISAFTERAVEHLRQDLELPAYNADEEGDDYV